jgi:hypothetical protein
VAVTLDVCWTSKSNGTLPSYLPRCTLFNHVFTRHSGIAPLVRFIPTTAHLLTPTKCISCQQTSYLWSLPRRNHTRGMPILVRARWAARRLPLEPLVGCKHLSWALGRLQARNYSTPRSRLVDLDAPQSNRTRVEKAGCVESRGIGREVMKMMRSR